jgi:glycosyltransferase involved in cell wall biosynthesis
MNDGGIRVSVVIPTYNRAEFLLETLESVFSQTVAPYEILVMDDGSTDATPDLLAAWTDRLLYARQENKGVAAARNLGLRLARGDWVAYLDSDDLWTPDKIERDRDAHQRHPTAKVLYGGSRRFSRGRVGRPRVPLADGRRLLQELALRNSLSVGGVTVRREALLEISGFIEDVTLGPSADWELWIRLASRYEFAYTGSATLLIREHPDNMMHDPARMEAAMSLAVERFLVDPIAGPRLAGTAQRIRSRANLSAAIGYYGCGDTEAARRRLEWARERDPFVVYEPMWIYTSVRSLLGDRWSSRLRRLKHSIAAHVSARAR